MKKVTLFLFIFSLIFSLYSCDVLESAANSLDTTSSTTASSSSGLTNGEVISGLKEALNVGINNAVDLTSVKDGFLKNGLIKIPFPESAQAMKEKALEWGLDKQVNKIVTTLNRAAEKAAVKATPIFVSAIKNMTIQDGFSILKGGDGAATNYLRANTEEQLISAFSPDVQKAIEQVKLTEYWEPVAKKYNTAMTFTGGEKVDTDLTKYVTKKAIDGLFLMVKKEENKIRENPAARVTDLLKKVFGSLSR